jgi:hypothetical protein
MAMLKNVGADRAPLLSKDPEMTASNLLSGFIFPTELL